MTEGTAPATGDPTTSTPPAGDPPTAPAPPAASATDDPAAGLGDAGQRALQAERDARKAAEKLAADTAKELKKYQDKDKSEAEKAAERIAELERENASLLTERQQARLGATVTAAARKAGFWDPDLAVALVNPADVQFDADGVPRNIEALVAAIAKEKPRLVNGGAGQPNYGGGPQGGAPSTADMNDLIRRSVRG